MELPPAGWPVPDMPQPARAGLGTGAVAPGGALAGPLAADARSLDRLRHAAGRDGQGAVREAARQLESLFMRELIKSMREATLKSGLTDSAQGDLASDLFDQQMALQMSGLPGGLSQAIERQLSAVMLRAPGAPAVAAAPGVSRGAAAHASVPAPLSAAVPAPMPNAADTLRARTADTAGTPAAAPAGNALGEIQRRFVDGLHRVAARVARDSGIPASYMLGQAALETGWGRQQIRMPDGSPSFNLFGIKADAQWRGKVAEVSTVEYVQGQPQRVTARFRAYDSYEQSFEDYARMIGQSPRYAAVRGQLHSPEAFAAGLQRAGYATDPRYADKLSRVIAMAQQRMV